MLLSGGERVRGRNGREGWAVSPGFGRGMLYGVHAHSKLYNTAIWQGICYCCYIALPYSIYMQHALAMLYFTSSLVHAGSGAGTLRSTWRLQHFYSRYQQFRMVLSLVLSDSTCTELLLPRQSILSILPEYLLVLRKGLQSEVDLMK